ncbi:MAG: hypothetical protein M1814_006382 [Vezdaea aestivalis]|nr:MAG: hypothetical protein M1814_006382 [Vezdaea aestivalis]
MFATFRLLPFALLGATALAALSANDIVAVFQNLTEQSYTIGAAVIQLQVLSSVQYETSRTGPYKDIRAGLENTDKIAKAQSALITGPKFNILAQIKVKDALKDYTAINVDTINALKDSSAYAPSTTRARNSIQALLPRVKSALDTLVDKVLTKAPNSASDISYYKKNLDDAYQSAITKYDKIEL